MYVYNMHEVVIYVAIAMYIWMQLYNHINIDPEVVGMGVQANLCPKYSWQLQNNIKFV